MKPNDSIRILNPQAKMDYNYINNAIRTCTSSSNVNNNSGNNNSSSNNNSNNPNNPTAGNNDNKTTTTTSTTNVMSNKTTGKTTTTMKPKSMKMSSSTTQNNSTTTDDTTTTTTTVIQNNEGETGVPTTKIENPEITEIPPNVKEALNKLVRNKFSTNLIKFETLPVSGRGENSYGSVLQFKVHLDTNDEQGGQQQQGEQQQGEKQQGEKQQGEKQQGEKQQGGQQQDQQQQQMSNNSNTKETKDSKDNKENVFYCVAKISPKNEARRETMKVVDYYKREIYIYNNVLAEYEKLQQSPDNKYNHNIHYLKNLDINAINDPDRAAQLMMMSAPKLYASSLEAPNEFLLLEDLQHSGYKRYNRNEPLTYEHTVLAIRELAKYHAMSFILKAKNPTKFNDIIDNIRTDNLFSDELSQVSVEFGKKYMKEAIKMLENDNNQTNIRLPRHKDEIIKNVTKLYDNFRDICTRLVNGELVEPHSVICHGDFWNNNILYKYDDENEPISAKVIDYQMARYASPVLDLVHYLFTCTGKDLRDKYFDDFKDSYYNQLANTLKNFDLDPNEIFPRLIFENQINQYGIYGFCMACYALPFFISDSSELPNLDKAAEAMRDVSESSSDDGESEEEKDLKRKTTALLEEYEMLNDRTKPIFRERMIGVLVDLGKYNLLDSVFLKK